MLLHDIAKEPETGNRDHRHAFRSAARAGAALHHAGFEIRDGFETHFDPWFRLTDSAHGFDTDLGAAVQDNSRLPQIMDGLGRLFGDDAAVIIKAIALHLSVTVVSA